MTWTAPTQNCDGSALTNLAGYRLRWGLGEAEAPATATTYTIPALPPGRWWVSIAAYTSAGLESQFVSVWKDVTPDQFKVAEPTAYTLVKGVDKFILLPVGTVAFNTQCVAGHNVNGHYVVPRASVTWSGTVKPDVVVARCQ